MQVTEVRAAIGRAFPAKAATIAVPEMISERYRSSDDAYAMAAAFHGRAWPALTIRELFEHREMLPALSPAAFVGCVAGYLDALVSDHDDAVAVRGDLQDYLLACLMPWPHQELAVQALTADRLAALDGPQREVIAAVLGVLADRGSTDAATVREAWVAPR